MKQSFVPINKLLEEPFFHILGFPRTTKRDLRNRIKELKKLGITSISFQGDSIIGRLHVLGKGYVGVVVLAKKQKRKFALKMRRVDSPRQNMNNEAELLKLANNVKVGPKFVENSKNFIVMEYLPGGKIALWVRELKRRGSSAVLRLVIKKILEDCYKLDQIGLDHGELSSINKHVLVGKSKVTIIDLESSSTKRRVSNVTSATQALYIGSGISKIIHKIYKTPSKEKIIKDLRNYKKMQDQQSFDKVLTTLKL